MSKEEILTPLQETAQINGVDFTVIIYNDALSAMEEYDNRDKWVSVKDAPLFTTDDKGYWICTEAGDKEFIAAVPYKDSRKPNEELWWIRHCIIEDKVGLCVVGENDNELAGWNMSDVVFYQPLPAPPKQ